MKILPVYYFPPVSWFAAAHHHQSVVLEQWCHYRKQNFFNRMDIKTPDKTLHLSIPVRKANEHLPLHARTISYDWRWQHDHWKSLESAYRRSPYFEYYEDEFREFFQTDEESLLTLNLKSITLVKELLDLEFEWKLSESYQDTAFYAVDLRDAFPSKGDAMPAGFHPEPYTQVFGTDFTPNLSILDLLFNKGPESARILEQSWR